MGNTQGMCDSTFFTEIFTEVVLKGRVRIAERPLYGPLSLRSLRFIAGKGIEDARFQAQLQNSRCALTSVLQQSFDYFCVGAMRVCRKV